MKTLHPLVLRSAAKPVSSSLMPATVGNRIKVALARTLLLEFASFAGPRRISLTAVLILAGTAVEGVGILLILPVADRDDFWVAGMASVIVFASVNRGPETRRSGNSWSTATALSSNL